MIAKTLKELGYAPEGKHFKELVRILSTLYDHERWSLSDTWINKNGEVTRFDPGEGWDLSKIWEKKLEELVHAIYQLLEEGYRPVLLAEIQDVHKTWSLVMVKESDQQRFHTPIHENYSLRSGLNRFYTIEHVAEICWNN